MKTGPKVILVTGGGGYLGSVLVPLLLEQGHRVKVLDCFYFGKAGLKKVRTHPGLQIIEDNLLNHEKHPNLFKGVDSVAHLASVSNDPTSDLDPSLTIRINFLTSVSLARRARHEGVERFVFMSSCAVYGSAGEALLVESSETGPVSLYALTKLEAERKLLALNSPEFSVTSLRLATLFGLSRRMRFDLAVNLMIKRVWQGLHLEVHGSGNQYRPFLHVADGADVILKTLEAEREKVAGEIFNVGRDELNFTISALAEDLGRRATAVEIRRLPKQEDPRSYNVSFRKLREKLGIALNRGLDQADVEIKDALESGQLQNPDAPEHYNLLVLKRASSSGNRPYSPASSPDCSKLPPVIPILRSDSRDATRHPRVVAMILAYNCERMLPRAYERVPHHLVDDLFVMDDGSKDDTSGAARKLGLKVFRNDPNRGYGGNVKAGLLKALEMGADYVVEVHGDGAQFNPQSIEHAIPLMARGVDLILGSRFQVPGRALENGMPLIRFVANRFLSFFDRLVLGLPLTEFHTGFRIYSRKLIETLPLSANSDDYLFSFQVIAQAAYFELEVAEVPVEADYKSEHTSHGLRGASVYAIRTFFELFNFVLASRGLRYTAEFPVQARRKKAALPVPENSLPATTADKQ